MLAPGATITQNGARMTWAEARPMLAGITEMVRDHRYEEVRRVVGDHAVVEEHVVVAVSPSGAPLRSRCSLAAAAGGGRKDASSATDVPCAPRPLAGARVSP